VIHGPLSLLLQPLISLLYTTNQYLSTTQITTLADETASLAGSSLIWHPGAWEQLLGRSQAELVGSGAELLRGLEKRLMFLRVTVGFTWAGEEECGGRLVVLGVKG